MLNAIIDEIDLGLNFTQGYVRTMDSFQNSCVTSIE